MRLRIVLATILLSGIIALSIAALMLSYRSDPAEATTPQTSATSSAQFAAASSAVPNTYIWYTVVKVVDGDTIAVMMDGKSVTIRLIGVDTPETVDPRKAVQCFGKAASDETKKILKGQSVRVVSDPSQGTYDKYGRTLAYVFAPSNSDPAGILVNEYLIAEGYGHEYTYNIPYQYQAEFKAAQAEAQREKKGLWADAACAAQSARTSSSKAPAASAVVATEPYDCTHNVYNCSSFSSQAQAQQVFTLCGGDAHDVHKLDSDGDGRVCESLP
jgi:micrococcal nuclease